MHTKCIHAAYKKHTKRVQNVAVVVAVPATGAGAVAIVTP